MEILSIVPVVGLALAWRRWQGVAASTALLHAVSAMVVILFLGALLTLLFPTTILLMVVGVFFFVVEAYRMYRERIPPPVPIGIFTILAVLYSLIHADSALVYYDEYSHWGVFIKEMLTSDELWGADTNALHPRNLPGTTLWQYFFAVFSERPEGASFLAQFTLLLTPLMVLWERITWKQVHWQFGVLVLVIVAVFNFGHGFTSLYVDHLLGAWFVGILLNFLRIQREKQWRQLAVFLLPLSVLVLTKATGALFAIAAAAIIALFILAFERQSGANAINKAQWSKAIAFPVIASVVCVSILSVWSSNRESLAVTGTQVDSTASIVSGIAARQSVFTEAQKTELSRRFSRILFHQQISKDKVSAQYNAFSYPVMAAYTDRFRLTTVSLLGFSLIALYFLWRGIVSADLRLPWLAGAVSVWLTAIFYIGALYLGTLYLSKSEAGLIFSSYVRYAHSMLLPVVLFCCAAMLPAFAGNRFPKVVMGENVTVPRHSLAFSIVLAAFLLFERPYVEPLYKKQIAPDFRVQTEPLANKVRASIGDASLWVFFPNSVNNGVLGEMLQYVLTPGHTYVEEDPNVVLHDNGELRNELRNWEYVWLASRNPETEIAAKKLLGQDLSEGVFRIDSDGEDLVFTPVTGVFDSRN